MARLTEIRVAMAEVVKPLVDKYAFAYMPDLLAVGPQGAAFVVIDPGDTLIERLTLAEGYQYLLRLRLVVGGASDEERQKRLDELVSPDGEGSAWAALEADGAMDGLADYLLVLKASNYGEMAGGVDGQRLLAAELECRVVVGGLA